jgi:ribosomal protein S14
MLFDKKSFLKFFFLLVLFYSYLSLMPQFIKSKTSKSSGNLFKSFLDHHVHILPFSSSKLFVKLSRQRHLYYDFEKSFKIFKYLELSSSFSNSRRSFVSIQFDSSLKNFSSMKYSPTTILNGRSVSFSKDFKLSRISLRKLAFFGLLPGVSKSSW